MPATVYNAFASFGRTTTTISAYVGYVAAAVLVCAGLYCLLFAKAVSITDTKTGRVTRSRPRVIGLVTIAFAVLVALASYANKYLASRSKGYAAFSGASTGMDLVFGRISGWMK